MFAHQGLAPVTCSTWHHSGSIHVCHVDRVQYCVNSLKIGDRRFCTHPDKQKFRTGADDSHCR